MKGKTMKRLIAGLMALLLTIGLLPLDMLGGAQEVKAATVSYEGKYSYDFTGFDTENILYNATSSPLPAILTAKKTSDDAVTVLSATPREDKWRTKVGKMQTQGGISGGKGYFTITVPAGYEATISYKYASGGTDERTAYLSGTLNDTSSAVKVSSSSNDTDVKTDKYEVTKAATDTVLYLWTGSSMYLYNIDIELRTVYGGKYSYDFTGFDTENILYNATSSPLPGVLVDKKTADSAVTVLSATPREDKWRTKVGKMQTQGGISGGKGYFTITVPAGYEAKISYKYASGGTDERTAYLSGTLSDTSNAVKVSSSSNDTDVKTDTYEVAKAATNTVLYLWTGSSMYLYNIDVELSRGGASGEAPVVSSATAAVDSTDATKINVTWETSTTGSGDGKTFVEVSSDNGSTYTAAGNVKFDAEKKVQYKPTASGTYIFKVYGKLGDTATTAVTTSSVDFKLPLAKPAPTASAVSTGAAIKVSWAEVPEATGYEVKVYDGTTLLSTKTTAETSIVIDSLTNGKEYGFTVMAKRGDDTSDVSSKVTASPVAPAAVPFEGMNANDQTNKNYTAADPTTALVGQNGTWKIITGDAINVVDIDPTFTSTNGYTFTKKVDTRGTGSLVKRAVELTVTEPSYVVLYATCSGTAKPSRTIKLADKDGKILNSFPLASKDATVVPSVAYNIEKAGTYYFYSTDGGAYIFGIGCYPGRAPRKDWAEVDAPVIDSVVNNGNGTVTVNYTMAFGDDGADSAMIVAYKGGYEAASVQVTSGESEALSLPEDGDYVFTMTAARAKCADKNSNSVELKGFKRPLATPTISWLNNLGNGSVYVDWNNVKADSFDVLYKVSGASDYTTAVTGNTTGNYTIEKLTAGKEYTVKVVAHSAAMGDSSAEGTIKVGDAKQQWYVAAIGSATGGSITVAGDKKTTNTDNGVMEVADVTNTDGKVLITCDESGKMSDSEDGFLYYYTKINPNTENFKLTATFKVTEITGSTVDNQTGLGIYAIDMAGYGNKDNKYYNSMAVGQWKMAVGYHTNGAKLTTGYVSCDTSDNSTALRTVDNKNMFSQQDPEYTVHVGDTFTYTLEKTNEGYVASMNGESFTFEGAGSLMVQEDGSLCVGLMAARKIEVEVSDIQFEKSAGTASGAAAGMTEPVFTVLSGNKTNSSDYEFIATSNVSGSILLWDYNRDHQISVPIEANGAVRIPWKLWNQGGYNIFNYEFYIDKSTPNLTDYNYISNYEFIVDWAAPIGKQLENIYVAPGAGGRGTKDDPTDLQYAINHAQPGQTIVLLDGVYYPNKTIVINRSQNGTASKPVYMMAEHTGKAVVDGSKLEPDQTVALVSLTGSYWNIYGIEFRNALGVGMRVNGNYNVVEMCQFHDNGNTGLQISRGGGEPNALELWPTGNLIKNCDSYDNCDLGRNDADGFAAKLTVGEGNKFYGCISHNNIDDGWDLYAKSVSGPIGAVVIENCVTYNNGWLSKDDPKTLSAKEFGEGNGFKLGGENMFGAHKLINSISFDNYAKGITSNSGPDCQVINCTSFNNSLNGSSYNLSLYTKASNPKAWTVTGTISLVDKNVSNSLGKASAYPVAELGASNGIMYSLRSESNYLYDGAASYNTQAVAASSDWFVSTDVSVKPTRNADGTINMHGLLEPKATAPANSGARLVTTGEAISKQAQPAGKVEISDSIVASSLTDAVKSATGAKTAEELKAYLEKVIVSSSDAKIKLDGVEATKVVDASVLLSYDSGATWVKATPENFPKKGVDITLPYPEGTNRYDYDFVIGHLVTEDCNGLKAGTMEYFSPVEDADGLRIHVMAASPFVIGWKYDEGDDSYGDIIKSVPTGDTTPIIPYLVMMLGSLAVCVSFALTGKKRKNGRSAE